MQDGITIPEAVTVIILGGASLSIPKGVTVPGEITVQNGGALNKYGTVTGKVTNEDGSTVKVPDTVTMTVKPITVAYGDTVTLTFTVKGSNGDNVTGSTATFYMTNGTSLGSEKASNDTANLNNV